MLLYMCACCPFTRDLSFCHLWLQAGTYLHNIQHDETHTNISNDMGPFSFFRAYLDSIRNEHKTAVCLKLYHFKQRIPYIHEKPMELGYTAWTIYTERPSASRGKYHITNEQRSWVNNTRSTFRYCLEPIVSVKNSVLPNMDWMSGY